MVQSLCSCKAEAFFTKWDNTAEATATATPTNSITNDASSTPGWLILRRSKTIFPTKKKPASVAESVEIDFRKEAFCSVKVYLFIL